MALQTNLFQYQLRHLSAVLPKLSATRERVKEQFSLNTILFINEASSFTSLSTRALNFGSYLKLTLESVGAAGHPTRNNQDISEVPKQ